MPLASANARSGVPSRATTTVLVSRASGSFGGKAKSSTSSDNRKATVPQRSQGRSRRQPRREYPCPSTTLSLPTPDTELSFPRKREPSAFRVFHVGRQSDKSLGSRLRGNDGHKHSPLFQIPDSNLLVRPQPAAPSPTPRSDDHT